MNRKLCTSIKTCGEDIKSYPPVPGDRMQERGTQWKATVQSEHGASSLCRRVREGGERTGRPGLIMDLKFVCRNAHVHARRWDAQLQNAPKTKERRKSVTCLITCP